MIKKLLRAARQRAAELGDAAASAAKAAEGLGDVFEAYQHTFKTEAVGIQANETGGGVIYAPLGASLRSVYSTCKDLWKSDDELIRFEFPWVRDYLSEPRYRKAAFYTEHRAGRSFSLRERHPATATEVKVGSKTAVMRKKAKFSRERAVLREGWEIERVA